MKDQHAPPTFSTFAGLSPRQIAAEFGALRRQRPGLKKAVGHLILSPGPEDRVLSKEEWRQALQIALAEHGAADAPHAAWLHADTDHPHLHIFFSRITASGEVVSDSQSYQKNRSASKKISQELHLEPLPTTSNPNAPGDRQAADNAARRAERRGDSGITATEIRAALAGAPDLADFQRRLADIGVEAEFQRRGAAAEIFGWKLRRSGADEWIKASTLAKDLSWPKICHRFQSDGMQQQPERMAERPIVALAPVPAESHTYDRRPAMLRGSLPGPGRALSARPADEQAKPLIDLRRIQERNLAPLQRSLIVLGGALLNVGAELVRAVMQWVAALLRKLGFQIRPIPEYQQVQPGALAYCAAPAPLPSEPAVDDENVELASEAVLKIAASVTQKDGDLLPDGDGRHQVVAAMKAEFGVATVATLPHDESANLAPGLKSDAVFMVSQRSERTAIQGLVVELERAAAAHKTAFFDHRAALDKVSAPELDRLFKIAQKSQQRMLSQVSMIEAAIKEKAEAAMQHLPLQAGAKAVIAAIQPLRDGMQVFSLFPSKEKFIDAADPFKSVVANFEKLLDLHPLPEVAGISGQAAHKNGFEAPRG